MTTNPHGHYTCGTLTEGNPTSIPIDGRMDVWISDQAGSTPLVATARDGTSTTIQLATPTASGTAGSGQTSARLDGRVFAKVVAAAYGTVRFAIVPLDAPPTVT